MIWFLESVSDCNKFAVSLSWGVLQTYAGYYHGVRSLQKKLPQLIYLNFVLHLS
jgi:SNF family Na+-dependent transporter